MRLQLDPDAVFIRTDDGLFQAGLQVIARGCAILGLEHPGKIQRIMETAQQRDIADRAGSGIVGYQLWNIFRR